jgi:hypothetical protein
MGGEPVKRIVISTILAWNLVIVALMLCSCTMTRVPGYFCRISVGQAIGFSITITDPESGQIIRLDYGTDGGSESFKQVGSGIAQGIITSTTTGK